jgi:ribosomal protein S18 acetylase RimI-like enzyme
MTTITQHTQLGIRKATQADREVAAATIAAAFLDDPVCRWLIPNEDRRREIFEPMFRLYVDAYLTHGETYLTADGTGVAVWLPPSTQLLTPEGEEAFVGAMVEIVGSDVERVFKLEETFAIHHPKVPHYYLQFLAVEPALHSRGIGSALLRQGLERSDAEGTPVYFESTSHRNRALYERHGFVCQKVFSLPDGGPELSCMWRDAQ